MPRSSADPAQVTSSAGYFARLLLIIFVVDLVEMWLLFDRISRLGQFQSALAEAVLLTLGCAPLTWYAVVRPLAWGNAAGAGPRISPAGLFIRVLTVIFLIEFPMMLFLPVILPDAGIAALYLADAGLTSFFCGPLLWWTLSKEQRSHIDSLNDLLRSPVKLYAMLLALVFMVDLVETPLISLIVPARENILNRFADAFLTVLIIAPLSWWFIIRPLRRAAQSEKSSSDTVRAQVVEAVVTIDEQGVVENFNPAAERIFGYTTAEIIGKPATLLFSGAGPALDQLVRAATATEKGLVPPVTHEASGRHRDGSALTLDVSLSRILYDGRRQFLLIMRDISGRKRAEEALRESEERFRQLYEQSEDAIIFFKPGTCYIIDANATTEKLYGYSKAELKEAGLERLSKPEDFARVSSAVSGIRRGEMSYLDRIANLRKDGTEIIVSMRGKVITLRGVDLVYCTFRNVTERIRLEEEARNIQARLIQANKMTSLGLLVSGVAHEINNPNNFIMANSQLLARSWEDVLKILREYYRENGDFLVGGIPFSEMAEQSPQLFAGIVDGARRINEIVNNLKNFARRDRVVTGLDVDVNQVVTAAVSILHHQLVRHTENFHLDLAENIPRVKGSSQQLEQVVINLLMNACQALPAKQFGIWVATGFDAAADRVTIAVRDEGGGMSRELGDRIMEPFFTTKLDSGGTGLGLSISHSIVKEHNGSLEFESEPGKGTTFIVKIPAGEPAGKEPSE